MQIQQYEFIRQIRQQFINCVFPISMRTTCQQKLLSKLKEIRNSKQNKVCSQAILILDPQTTKIFNSLLTLECLFECGINELTRAQLAKKPSLTTASIYYICSDSLTHLFRDFNTQPIFHSVNVLLSQPVKPQIMFTLSKSTLLLERLSSFGQLTLNTIYLNDSIGLFANGPLLPNILKQSRQVASTITPCIVQALSCGFPQDCSFEVYSRQSIIGNMVGEQLRKLFQGKDQKNKINVMVFERTYDIASPLVRGFHYLPLLMDLCSVSLVPLTLTQGTKAESLKWDNPHLTMYRSMHIATVLERVKRDLEHFTQSNEAAKMHKNKGEVELREVVRGLGDYTNTTKSLSTHIQLMETLAKISTDKGIPQIGDLEHTLISGVNSKGQSKKDSSLLNKVLEKVQILCSNNISNGNGSGNGNNDGNTNKINAVRLLFLSLLTLNVSDKKPLLQKLSAMEYPGLCAFGKRVEKCPVQSNKYAYLNRHQCKMAMEFERAIRGTNSLEDKFKKLRKTNNKWVICVVGGVGLNEFVHFENTAKDNSCQLYLLTDCLYTPKQYLQMLNQCGKAMK